MVYLIQNFKSRLLFRLLSKWSNRSIFSSPIRNFAQKDDVVQSPPPPLKFSETSAYGPRQIRGQPSALPLSFWEGMETKGESYEQANRLSFYISLAVFMIYFMVLRQENDIDEELSKPLWQRLPSLEEQVLHERIILGKSKGDDVTKYELRYNQLMDSKKEEQERLLKKNFR